MVHHGVTRAKGAVFKKDARKRAMVISSYALPALAIPKPFSSYSRMVQMQRSVKKTAALRRNVPH